MISAHASLTPDTLHRTSPCLANLDIVLDSRAGIFWSFMRPQGRPSFTEPLLQDLVQMHQTARQLWADGEKFDFLVLASRSPGIFNLGGDLGLFAAHIRAGDAEGLRRYAHAAVGLIHRQYQALDLPVVTLALVQGDALGGGLECALACDVIIAERGSRMGLPEILFNLFPGMGAYSLLARRIGALAAERMITSGSVYTAEALHAMGVVDVLAEPGAGVATLGDYVARQRRRHNAHLAIYRARRLVHPLGWAELRDIADLWVGAALRLGAGDLRKMARLCAAQDRRLGAAGCAIAAE